MLLAVPHLSWGQSGAYTMASKKKYTPTVPQTEQVTITYVDDPDDSDYLPVTTGAVRDVDEYNRRGAYSPYANNTRDSITYVDTTAAYQMRSAVDDAYTQGYREGYSDGEDYGITRRLTRFGYTSIYCCMKRLDNCRAQRLCYISYSESDNLFVGICLE